MYELGGSKYGDKIKIQKGKIKKGNIIFSNSLSSEEALQQEICLKNGVQVRDVAFLQRRSILNAKRNPFPEHLKLTDILQGEVEVP